MSRYLRIWGRFGQHRHDRRQHHRQHDGNGFDFRDDFRQRRHDFWNCRGWQRHASYLQQHHRLDYDKWRGYEWQSIHRRVCLARRDSSNRRHEHDFGQHRRQRDDREQNAATSSASTTAQQVTGILSAGTSASITGNTVANLNNNYAGATVFGQIRGIVTSSGVNTITGNTVRNLSTTSLNQSSATLQSVFGIIQTSTTAGQGLDECNGEFDRRKRRGADGTNFRVRLFSI